MRYIADLFCGEAGVGRAVADLGCPARLWDTRIGEWLDLTSPTVQRQLERDVKAGLVLGACLAVPCTSFSVARMRTCITRSAREPWGLRDKSKFSARDHESVKLGNRTLRAALKLIRLFNRYGVPWVLENPYSSMLWKIPAIRQLASKPSSFNLTVDFCSYGTPWRKRTCFLFGNLRREHAAHMQDHICQGRGQCSFTGKKHIELTGPRPVRRVPWARVAEPYPRKLCTALAHVFLAAASENIP